MKTLAAFALALLVCAGVGAPADAFTPGGAFKLSGPLTIRTPGQAPSFCTVSLSLVSTPSGTSVVGAVFGGAQGCALISAFQLPWTVTNPTPTTVKIAPMVFASNVACAAPSVTGTWSNASPGVLTVAGAPMPPICTIDATLSAAPAQTLP